MPLKRIMGELTAKDVIGNSFKFNDYYLSLGHEEIVSFVINPIVQLEEAFKNIIHRELKIDLDLLIYSAPFNVNKNFLSHNYI
jgi:hypothetical protein